jgi:signal transduction histidine kinase
LKFTRFNLRSIKARVTFSTLAIFVLSLWALSFFTSRLLQNDMQRLLGEQQFSTASFIAAAINDALRERVATLEGIAQQIDPHLMSHPAALQTFLEQRLILQRLFNSGAFVVGIDGVAIAEVPVSVGRIGHSYADRDYMVEILKGKSTISTPVMGKRVKAPSLPIAVPIRDPEGKVIGGLVTSNNLGQPNFLDNLTQSGYGKTGGYLLVAPQSRLIVTATDKSRIMETLPPVVSPLIERFIQGYEGSGVTVNPLGVEVLASAKGVPVPGWYVVAALPIAEAFAPIHAMQQRMVWATIILTLLASGLTWWILKRQLAPMLATVNTLAHLAESTQRLQPLPITRQDEIGELIGGFNRLLETLGRRDDALRTSEQSLRLSEELMSISQQIGGTGSWVYDLGTNGIWASAQSLATFGFPPVAKDYPLDDFLACIPERERVQQTLSAAISAGRVYEDEYVVHPADGSQPRVVNVIGRLERDAPGNPLRVLGFLQDITKRRQAEQALQQQAEALARSNAELEQFAYVVSHDLRQPLRMVNSYVQILEQSLADTLDDDTREMMHFATEGAKRMDQMLLSLIEYSRVGRKGEPLALLSSRAGVDEALHFLAPVIHEANATVRVSGDWPEVLASRDEFTRLWQNLIGNALKYRAPDRVPDINITVMPDADGWRFCVADNGIGINPTQFNRLFQVFQRLHTRDQYEGTGIGLAVARKIVERHNGRIWVESAGADQGCRFCFSLPMTSSAPAAVSP